jgi:hypothetical protein
MRANAESSDVLTGGRWVAVRGVSRWVPEYGPPIAPYATFIACTYCRAQVAETCKTSTGRSRTPHAGRLVSRLCPCGASVEKYKNYCELCRVEARRATWRKVAERKRQAKVERYDARREGAA